MNNQLQISKHSSYQSRSSSALSSHRDVSVDVFEAAGYVGFNHLAARAWGRRYLILIAVIVGLSAAWTVVRYQTPVYRAASAVEIQIPNDDYLNRRQLDPSVKPGPILLEQFLQTELRLLQSDTLFSEVIKNLGLATLAEFNPPPGLLSRWRGHSPAAAGPPGMGPLLEQFRSRVAVRMVGQTQIAEVTFEASQPELAAAVVNSLVDRYRLQSQWRRAAAASETADLLAGQLKELDAGLSNAQRRLRDFFKREGIVGSLDKESLAETKLRQMQGALASAFESRVSEEARIGAVGPGGLEAAETETLARYRLRLAELRQKKAEISEVMTPAHFKVKQVQAEIDEVQRSLDNEQRVMMGRAQGNLKAAISREKALQKRFDEQSGLVAGQASAAMRFGSLKNEMDTYQQLHNSMLQRVKEARLAAGIPATSVHVVDRAMPPYRPVRPNKPLSFALGGVAGLLLGLLLAMWPAPIHDRNRSQGLPHSTRHSRALGEIPCLEPPLGAVVSLVPSPELNEHLKLPELNSWAEPDSAGAASFSRIAARLWPVESPLWPKIVAVTSAAAGAGKTTVACNLALTAARQGRRVLLVDADYVNPRLHRIFGVAENPGLLEHMAMGRGKPLPLAGQVAGSGLRVLPLGPPPEAPLSADEIRQWAAGLKRDFDTVILDTPSLTPTDDAIHLIRHADGAIVVIGPGDQSAEAGSAAEALLAGNGITVLGSVANQGAGGSRPRVSRREIAL